MLNFKTGQTRWARFRLPAMLSFAKAQSEMKGILPGDETVENLHLAQAQ